MATHCQHETAISRKTQQKLKTTKIFQVFRFFGNNFFRCIFSLIYVNIFGIHVVKLCFLFIYNVLLQQQNAKNWRTLQTNRPLVKCLFFSKIIIIFLSITSSLKFLKWYTQNEKDIFLLANVITCKQYYTHWTEKSSEKSFQKTNRKLQLSFRKF